MKDKKGLKELLKVEKRKSGFFYGKYSLKVIETIGEVEHNKRKYKFLKVQTQDTMQYFCIRLYNEKGKFIKQFLFEPEILNKLICLLQKGLEV
jgi:hypothetical protein